MITTIWRGSFDEIMHPQFKVIDLSVPRVARRARKQISMPTRPWQEREGASFHASRIQTHTHTGCRHYAFRGLFGSSLLLSRYIHHRNRSQRQTGITALPVKYDEKREYVRKRGPICCIYGTVGEKEKSLGARRKCPFCPLSFHSTTSCSTRRRPRRPRRSRRRQLLLVRQSCWASGSGRFHPPPKSRSRYRQSRLELERLGWSKRPKRKQHRQSRSSRRRQKPRRN